MAAPRRARPRPATNKKAAPQPAEVVSDDIATDTQEPVDSPAEDHTDGNSDAVNDIPDAGPPEDGDDDEIATPEDENSDDNTAEIEDSEFRAYWREYAEENRIALPDGHVLFPGEPQTFHGNVIRGSVVEVTQDTYRMVIPFRSKRATFVLVARAGAILSKAKFVTAESYRAETKNALNELLGE